MDLTVWVDVALGVTIVYLGTSLFVTIINEYIAQLMNLRGRNLFNSLKQLIADPGLRTKLQAIPTLRPYFQEADHVWTRLRGHSISYVDTQVLAQMLLELILPQSSTTAPSEQSTLPQPPPNSSTPAVPDPEQPTPPTTHTDLTEKAEVLQKLAQVKIDPALKTQLEAVIHSASDSMESVTQAVSSWADRSLTMLGEHYKRNMQILSFIVSLFVAGILNIDTVALIERLYKDKELRTTVAEFAIRFGEQQRSNDIQACLGKSADAQKQDDKCNDLLGQVDAIQSKNKDLGQLPIGWSDAATSQTSQPLRMVGWFLTALAASLGAPFWFDLLTKVVNVRHGMRRPEVVAAEKK